MQHNRRDKFGQSTQDKLRELFYSRYVKQHHTSQLNLYGVQKMLPLTIQEYSQDKMDVHILQESE